MPGVGVMAISCSAFSTLFNVASVSFVQCKGVAPPVFRVCFFPQRKLFHDSYRFAVSVGGSELRIFLCHRLEQDL